MKSALILVGAALAVAQNFSGQPSCATSCLSVAITGAGCALDDAACQCGPTQASIAASAAPCLLTACPVTDLSQAQSAGAAACAAYSASAGSGDSSSGTITTGPTATDSLSSTLAHSGDTIIGISTNSTGSATDTKTIVGTVQTPSVSNTASVSGTGSTPNLAPTAAPAKIVGGVLAGLLGVVAAL
ncbi:hypothetical protein PFICI_09870 [Pestalotiopsis fici W106-1]|uniref:CFEM domain-containing protein n=1 Tax=Pestalotiopsis fici (strain W106-1 / CGMCC3.15140) TaxID=1229662 RepID=W3WVB2_PESFW|nr:uncharacterized protein PFICI_09870 [Pestalotiopsis fici W106-1]ETS77808.1 hypothetical protein PFICI_09870 [Pestalotiopsis fici W106-1]